MLTIIYNDTTGTPQRIEGDSLFADHTGLYIGRDTIDDMLHIEPSGISGGVNVAIAAPQPKPTRGAMELMRAMTRAVTRPYSNMNAALWLVLCLALASWSTASASLVGEVRGQRSEVSVQALATHYVPTAHLASDDQEPKASSTPPLWLAITCGVLGAIGFVLCMSSWWQHEQADRDAWRMDFDGESGRYIGERRAFVERVKHGARSTEQGVKPHVQAIVTKAQREPLKFSLGSW